MSLRSRIMALATTTLLCGLASTSYAAALNGFYLGGEMGWGNQDNSSGEVLPFSSGVNHNGVAPRIMGGYQFNHYMAIEGGYTFYMKDVMTDLYQTGLDLEGKFMLPLNNQVDIYAKVGASQLFVQNGSDGLSPLYGLGVDYDVSPKVVTNIGWMRTVGAGSVNDSNYVGVGLSYHFA